MQVPQGRIDVGRTGGVTEAGTGRTCRAARTTAAGTGRAGSAGGTPGRFASRPLRAPSPTAPNVRSPTVTWGVTMAQAIGMSDEVRELRARMKAFIDDVVFKAEPELERQSRARLPPRHRPAASSSTRRPRRAARTRARGVRGPGDAASRRNTGVMADLKAEAKARGLWALGHPAEIGGGGLPFMDFVYLNEIIGRSEYGQVAVGSATHAGLDHAPPVRQRRAARALPRAARRRRRVPVGRPHRARGGRQRPDPDADDGRTSTATSGSSTATSGSRPARRGPRSPRCSPRPSPTPRSTCSSARSSCRPTRPAT